MSLCIPRPRIRGFYMFFVSVLNILRLFLCIFNVFISISRQIPDLLNFFCVCITKRRFFFIRTYMWNMKNVSCRSSQLHVSQKYIWLTFVGCLFLADIIEARCVLKWVLNSHWARVSLHVSMTFVFNLKWNVWWLLTRDFWRYMDLIVWKMLQCCVFRSVEEC